MAQPRANSGLPEIRKRIADRVGLLGDPFRVSSRAFSLSEVPDGLSHGSFFVKMPGGISLDTWKVNDANGWDWLSPVETHILFRLGPHQSIANEDEALRMGHRVAIQLVRQTDDWPIDLRFKGSDVTITVEPDTSGNSILIVVGTPCRHRLSITEVT